MSYLKRTLVFFIICALIVTTSCKSKKKRNSVSQLGANVITAEKTEEKPFEFNLVEVCTDYLCIKDIMTKGSFRVPRLPSSPVSKKTEVKIYSCELDPNLPAPSLASCEQKETVQDVNTSRENIFDIGNFQEYQTKSDLIYLMDAALIYSAQYVRQINICSRDDFIKYSVDIPEQLKPEILQEYSKATQRLANPTRYMDRLLYGEEKNGLSLIDDEITPVPSQVAQDNDTLQYYRVDDNKRYKVVTSIYQPAIEFKGELSSLMTSIAFGVGGRVVNDPIPKTTIDKATRAEINSNKISKAHSGYQTGLAADAFLARVTDLLTYGRGTKEEVVQAGGELVKEASQIAGAASETAALGGATKEGFSGFAVKDVGATIPADLPKTSVLRKVTNSKLYADIVRAVIDGVVVGATGFGFPGKGWGEGVGISITAPRETLEDLLTRAYVGGRLKQGGNVEIDVMNVITNTMYAHWLQRDAGWAAVGLEAAQASIKSGLLAFGDLDTVLYEVYEVDSENPEIKEGQKPVHTYSYPPSVEFPGTASREQLDAIYDNINTIRFERNGTIDGAEYQKVLLEMANKINQAHGNKMVEILNRQGALIDRAEQVINRMNQLERNVVGISEVEFRKSIHQVMAIYTDDIANFSAKGRLEIDHSDLAVFNFKSALIQTAIQEGYTFTNFNANQIRTARKVPKNEQELNQSLREINAILDNINDVDAKNSNLLKTVKVLTTNRQSWDSDADFKVELQDILEKRAKFNGAVAEFHPHRYSPASLRSARDHHDNTSKCLAVACAEIEKKIGDRNFKDYVKIIGDDAAKPRDLKKLLLEVENPAERSQDLFNKGLQDGEYRFSINDPTGWLKFSPVIDVPSRTVQSGLLIAGLNKTIEAAKSVKDQASDALSTLRSGSQRNSSEVPEVPSIDAGDNPSRPSSSRSTSVDNSSKAARSTSSVSEDSFKTAVSNQSNFEPFKSPRPTPQPTTVRSKPKIRLLDQDILIGGALIPEQVTDEEKQTICGAHPVNLIQRLAVLQGEIDVLSAHLLLQKTLNSPKSEAGNN